MIETDDAAASLYPGMKPGATPDDWRIDLKYLPVGYHGRSFLALVDPDGMTANELHGLRDVKDADDASGVAPFSVVHDTIDDTNPPRFDEKKDGVRHIATIASGAKNEMAQLWGLGRQAGTAIDPRALADADDTPDGGGANHVLAGNAVTHTLAKAMGFDVTDAIKATGMHQKFPGHDRDLLEPGDDKNIVRVKGPTEDVEMAQQRAPQQRTPPQSARPKPEKAGEEITREAEDRRDATLNQTHRQREWDYMVRQLPRPTPRENTKIQAPLPHDWRAAINAVDPRYVKFTEDAAKKYSIPPELLARLLYRESTYKNEPAGPDKAQGIPQMFSGALIDVGLDPKTFSQIGPEKQIDAGAKYLAQKYAEFRDWSKAVAAYHSGAEQMREWLSGHGRDFDSATQRIASFASSDPNRAKREIQRREEPKRARSAIQRWRELEGYLPYIFLGNPNRYD